MFHKRTSTYKIESLYHWELVYRSPSRSPSPPSSSLPSAQCTEFCQVKRDLANPRLDKPWHKFQGGYRLWRQSSSKKQNPLPSPPHCTWDKLKLRSCWKAVMWWFFHLKSICVTIFTWERFGREHIQNLKPSQQLVLVACSNEFSAKRKLQKNFDR